MNTSKELKEVVKNKYAQIVKQSEEREQSTGCCETSGCCESAEIDYTIFNDDYSDLKGYVAEADLNLGCGIPTEFAGIEAGDTVVDLGSGAGNDVFVARALTGEEGKVIGIDFTDEMIQKALKNNSKLGFTNVEFIFGEIENIPLENNSADVVISNCVLNLVPDKEKAFSEIFRILKPKGHFCISDIVIMGELPEGLRKSASMYAGCISGALQKDDYLAYIAKTGFTDIDVKRTVRNNLPDELLSEYLNEEEIIAFKERDFGIFSITVTGIKK
jgi:ubiquinone/menaquinone biosynthesis C-methylase UbiE